MNGTDGMINRAFAVVVSLCLLLLQMAAPIEADELQQLLQAGEYIQALEQVRAHQDVGLR